jgi:hypothetical protein
MEWLGYSEPRYVCRVRRVDLSCCDCRRVVHCDEQLGAEALAGAWPGDLQPRSFLFPRLYQYPVNPDWATHDLELGILLPLPLYHRAQPPASPRYVLFCLSRTTVTHSQLGSSRPHLAQSFAISFSNEVVALRGYAL